MQFIGIIKRVIPFFLTFVAGLFIASFFVSLSAPRFEGFNKNRSHKFGKFNRLKAENEELRRDNLELKRQIEEMSEFSNGIGYGEGDGDGILIKPDFNNAVPPPRVKEMKMKTVTVK